MSKTEEQTALTKRAEAIERLATVTMSGKGVELKTVPDALKVCELIVSSGLGPNSLNSVSKVFIALQTGAEAGLTVMASLRSVVVIEGNPSWRGDAVLALIRNSGVCKRLKVFNDGDGDARRGVVAFERKDTDDGPVEVSYTVADAKRANLWGKRPSRGPAPWITDPDAMLVWRAVSRAGKRYFSDVLLGLDVAEVVRDYEPERPALAVGVESAWGTPPADAKPVEPDPLLDGAPEVVAVDAAGRDSAKVEPVPTRPPTRPEDEPERPATDGPAEASSSTEGPTEPVEATDSGPIGDWEVHLARGDKTDTVTVAARTKAEAGAAAARKGWRITAANQVGQGSLLDGGA